MIGPNARTLMLNYVCVAVGSALGGVFRYWCGIVAAALGGDAFPWGTIVINIAGSFIIGAFGGVTGPDGRLLVRPWVRIFVMVGFCGGYTTFSSFSLQTFELLQRHQPLAAAANIGLSVAVCLIAVWLGDGWARGLGPRRRLT